ncbi:hypothetical protein [Mycolicibacterium pyrenivorans]|uniref:hypothetical protein n=1 Tax=Mycolicibacterium pyrenivorans TaxID=187102 RepID=UPI0021F393F3|nr:hypothetical protein [Mycolicibacterium pyrenivorans]
MVRPLRYGIAAMALWVGLVVTPAPVVAWADSTGSTSTSRATAGSDNPVSGEAEKDDAPSDPGEGANGQDEPETAGPQGDDADPDAEISDAETAADADASDADDSSDTAGPQGEVADPVEPESATTPEDLHEQAPPAGSPSSESVIPDDDVAEVDSTTGQGGVAAEAEPDRDEHPVGRPEAAPSPAARLLTIEVPSAQLVLAEPSVATQADTSTSALVAVTSETAVEEATPTAPQPLSPLAELLQLPGRMINVLLQVFDLTESASSPQSPINFEPINNLLFAAFRELERLFGLDRTPPVLPAVPTLTYDGPTTAPTPTVAQFLNASAAGYVLGSTPGGLVPFTVNGFQVVSTNIFSGMVGRAWVTPEGQVIIAYQGTTGGSHLLFNPLITISQVLADLQVIFTRTTPWAFYDALRFAQRVQAAAALQGYGSEDIFVTGHSLGGWEAQYVAQQIGLAGIGFEAPGINTIVPGNGSDSMFVNIGTYGSTAPYMSTDLPGLQPFMPAYVPGGGSKPHYGPIVMIGEPAAMTPLYNASALWGRSLIGSIIFLVDFLGNFFQYHLPGVQAYHLDVAPDPGMVTWLGTSRGPVHTGYGALTIPQLMKAASDDGILFKP